VFIEYFALTEAYRRETLDQSNMLFLDG